MKQPPFQLPSKVSALLLHQTLRLLAAEACGAWDWSCLPQGPQALKLSWLAAEQLL